MSAESARSEAEEFRRLAEDVREVRDEHRGALDTVREERERLREVGETARVAGEHARAGAEAARLATMNAVHATAETLQATLEHMKVVEEMRRTLRNKGPEQARRQLSLPWDAMPIRPVWLEVERKLSNMPDVLGQRWRRVRMRGHSGRGTTDIDALSARRTRVVFAFSTACAARLNRLALTLRQPLIDLGEARSDSRARLGETGVTSVTPSQQRPFVP
jgi:hypothetical protein